MNVAFASLQQPGEIEPDCIPSDILLIDPSLFTAPYDAALSDGLEAIGARPRWVTRGLRAGEEDVVGSWRSRRFFYPMSDGAKRRRGRTWRLLKGVEHIQGMRQLVNLVRCEPIDLVHFQWLLMPAVDLRAIRRIRRKCPVVLTVHDSNPFNGKSVGAAQRTGLQAALAAADRIIVHTGRGKEILVALGLDPHRIAVVPHGLLASSWPQPKEWSGGTWRILLFGKLQDYKGIDILIEALGALDPPTRDRLEVIVAGEALIPVQPLLDRAAALGLSPKNLEIRSGRLSDSALDALIETADAFVFPYRAIEASGALYLVATAGRWIVASDLGAFSELLGKDGRAGALVPAGDADALAEALRDSIGRRPQRDVSAVVPGWDHIAEMTRQVYGEATASWRREREAAS